VDRQLKGEKGTTEQEVEARLDQVRGEGWMLSVCCRAAYGAVARAVGSKIVSQLRVPPALFSLNVLFLFPFCTYSRLRHRLLRLHVQVMALFRYLQEKDVFEAFYKKNLAKRLLLGMRDSVSFCADSCVLWPFQSTGLLSACARMLGDVGGAERPVLVLTSRSMSDHSLLRYISAQASPPTTTRSATCCPS
jgi:hypothetical protein